MSDVRGQKTDIRRRGKDERSTSNIEWGRSDGEQQV